MIARRAFVLAVLALLALAATASASTISLKCGGKGGRYQSEPSSISCAAKLGQSRTIEGVVRDDANKPVAGPVTVTLSKWIPQGGYYTVEPFKTLTVSANAAGKFSYKAKTATKITARFEAAGAAAEAEVSRELQVKVAKLGGGKVKVTVKGAGKAPLTVYLVDTEAGYELPGTKGKKASKAGVAIFNLGRFHGAFTYSIDAGDYSDLFWAGPKPTFRI